MISHHDVPCCMCRSRVPVQKLKQHIFLRHFPFYRPYNCKTCPFKCPSSEIFVQEHQVVADHIDFDIRGELVPHLELLVELFYRHSVRLQSGEVEKLFQQLQNIKIIVGNIKSKHLLKQSSVDGTGDESLIFRADSYLADNLCVVNSNDENAVGANSQNNSVKESAPASTAFKTPGKRKRDRISKDADELANVLVEPAQKLAFNSLDQGGNLFDNAASNFAHHVAEPSPTIDNSRISSIDSLIDEKTLPVFNNVNGTDRCSPMSSTSTHPFNSPCSSPDDATPNPSLSAITCDFCQEICVNKEVLKQHLMANHAAGYCTHYCSLCDFKDTNFRRMTEHARKEHKSTKCLKNCTPNDEQYDLLIKIKESLQKRRIDFELPKRI